MQCLQDSVSIVLPGSAPPAPTVGLARFPWSDPARRGPEPSRRSPVASPADVYQALREAHARADAVAAASSVLAEWTSSYTEAGRRWSGTPGVSVVELGREGISYHRDYQ